MWLWSVFTRHQGGHGVPKQYNGGYVGFPNPISSPVPQLPRCGMRNPVGVKLGVSYVSAFFCTDAGHESENAVFLLFSRNTEPVVVENDSCQAKSGWQIVTASLQSRFHNTETFFRYFFSVWPLLLPRFTIETAFLTHHRTLMKSSSHVLRLSHVHKQKSVVYIHSKWKQLISNVSNLVLTWISEHWSSIANFYTHNDKEWYYRQGRSTCLRSAGEYRGKPKILYKKDN